MNGKTIGYFSKEELMIFIDTFEKQGYVIDEKEEKGSFFSSMQIKNMTSKSYISLCSEYDIYSYDTLYVTCCHYSGYGTIYIAFDEYQFNLDSASILLDKYFDSLHTEKEA